MPNEQNTKIQNPKFKIKDSCGEGEIKLACGCIMPIVAAVFCLQFLYLWKVLIKNPDDAKLAPLGKLSNMQIRAAITDYYTR